MHNNVIMNPAFAQHQVKQLNCIYFLFCRTRFQSTTENPLDKLQVLDKYHYEVHVYLQQPFFKQGVLTELSAKM